ncbi:MAG: exo-alpha-sialidase [Candidatus Latescibacteria bacterium]|nr:exo-alpha-sialidase [Candidatus Latescibacterota bacterium]
MNTRETDKCGPCDPAERHSLRYKGHEAVWQFVNGPWRTNDEGDVISPASSFWAMDSHSAFQTERMYRDCVVTGKWQFCYAGGACPELIVRSLDSRRFYAVSFSTQTNLPSTDAFIMASIWKGCDDGYQRMLGYRRKVGIYRADVEPEKWYSVRVECVGPEIIVYFEDHFACRIMDEAYPKGVIGVGCTEGRAAWKDLEVTGRPVEPGEAWRMAETETETPRLFTVGWDPRITGKQAGAAATLLPDDEILVGFSGVPRTHWVTRSRDYGLSWDDPEEGRFGHYVRSLDQFWSIHTEHNPAVTWVDTGRNFDELNRDNFWNVLSRSMDGGKTWSEIERMNVPFPAGQAYASIRGKAGSVLLLDTQTVGELRDGTIAVSGFWRNNPDGNYHSDQVQFARTEDGGKTWSVNPVDPTEWERNESTWVELKNGELLCIMRSNYSNSVGQSRSRDMGKTWSKVRPAGIPFFGPSCPAVMRTRDDTLILAVRGWGIFTSVDDGWTWSLPTRIRGYTGSGMGASLLEMSDGRILVLSATHANAPNGRIMGQFIRVDRDAGIHPALPGPTT